VAKNKLSNRVFAIFVAIITIISVAGIFTGSSTSNSPSSQTGNSSAQNQAAYKVPCSTSKAFSTQSHLTILIDGTDVSLPSNIGVLSQCALEIHTEGTDGTIHVESNIDKGYTFADFLSLLGITLEQAGYLTRLTVNGEFNDNDTSFKLENNQEIKLEYIGPPVEGMRVGTTTATTSSSSQ
jgi:hypothetical protein